MTYLAIGEHRLVEAHVHVPARGAWWAEVTFEDDAADVQGSVVLSAGGLELSCTVDARYNGTHGLQRRARLVAGGGGWSQLLPARAYHNDAEVKARTVVEDAAREAGEVLGDFLPARERVGVHYVRQAGPASRALEDVVGGVLWWVGYDGRTVVGSRPTAEAAPGSYEVLAYDPSARLATLAVDDLAAVGVGSVLVERLDAPQTVQELRMHLTSGNVRLVAWTGDGGAGRGRLAGALARIVERVSDRRLFGKWRYRVVRMVPSGGEFGAPDASTRAELQAVSREAGLPDVLPVAFRPGLAGAHARLQLGAEVLVEFVEGDRTRPVVTGFMGVDGEGFIPVETSISASTVLRLGARGATSRAAREGDTVQVEIPAGAVIVAVSGGTPNATPIILEGTITSGSDKVRVQ